MQHIHFFVWLGLAIHTVLTALFGLSQALGPVTDVLYVFFFLQIVGIILLIKNKPLGAVLACIGGLIYVPLCIIFLLGVGFSYSRMRHRRLTRAPSLPIGATTKFPFTGTHTLIFLGGIIMLLGVVIIRERIPGAVGGITFGLGLTVFWLGTWCRKQCYFALSRQALYVNPFYGADLYHIPFADITALETPTPTTLLCRIHKDGEDDTLLLRAPLVIGPQRGQALGTVQSTYASWQAARQSEQASAHAGEEAGQGAPNSDAP